MPNIATREPIVTAAVIVTAIGALVAALNAFGVTHITDEQLRSMGSAIVALWPLLLVIRQIVTPTAAPVLSEGTSVTVVTPPDQPNKTTVL